MREKISIVLGFLFITFLIPSVSAISNPTSEEIGKEKIKADRLLKAEQKREKIKEIKVALLEYSISYVVLSSNLPYIEVEVEDGKELNHVRKVIEYVLNERKFDVEERMQGSPLLGYIT